MKKRILKLTLWIIFMIVLFFLPLGIEKLIVNGLFGFEFPKTSFTREHWFAFWGSYIGAIITVIVLFITIRYNKLETKKMLQDYELERKYERLLKSLQSIHYYINLCDEYGNGFEDTMIIYSLRLTDKRQLSLMNECEQDLLKIDSAYIPLVKQIFYEYLLEADKVPKDFTEISKEDAAKIYKESTKMICSIKHKYINKEGVLYDKVIKEIDEFHIKEKKDLFL